MSERVTCLRDCCRLCPVDQNVRTTGCRTTYEFTFMCIEVSKLVIFTAPPPPFFADIFDDNGQCLDSAELLAS